MLVAADVNPFPAGALDGLRPWSAARFSLLRYEVALVT